MARIGRWEFGRRNWWDVGLAGGGPSTMLGDGIVTPKTDI